AEEESSVAGVHRSEPSLTFDSAEAMIRHDAAQVTVPPQMRDRVMKSIAQEIQPSRPLPWWKRWKPF
ncbi:MAG: hypothetical protein JWO82_97, partial [Akkermansiaceae bacterium]|nr:hypothetical protein [Akkermansiaceae bacterium]